MFQVWYGNRLREKMNFGSGRRQKDFYIKRSLQSTEINSFQNRERISSHWLFLITLISHVPTCGTTPLFINKSISGHQQISCLPNKDLLLYCKRLLLNTVIMTKLLFISRCFRKCLYFLPENMCACLEVKCRQRGKSVSKRTYLIFCGGCQNKL